MWIRYTGYIQTNMAVTWPLVHTSTGTCQPHPPRKRDGDDRFTQLRKLARMPGLETDTVICIPNNNHKFTDRMDALREPGFPSLLFFGGNN